MIIIMTNTVKNQIGKNIAEDNIIKDKKYLFRF